MEKSKKKIPFFPSGTCNFTEEGYILFSLRGFELQTNILT